MTKKSYFYCYNPRLRQFIHEVHGISWVDKGVNTNSGYMRWIFERSDKLSEAIESYKRINARN